MKLIKGERGIMNTLQWLVIKVRELLANKDNGSSGGGTIIQENIIRVLSATYSELGVTPESTLEEKQEAIATFLQGYDNLGTDVLMFEILEDVIIIIEPFNFRLKNNWVELGVIDVDTFRNWLNTPSLSSNWEYGKYQKYNQWTGVQEQATYSINNFNLIDDVITCEIIGDGNLVGIQMENLDDFTQLVVPNDIKYLYLEQNSFTVINPELPLPELYLLALTDNQISDWSLSEPWANLQPNGDSTIYLGNNPTSSDGTNFKTILINKGYTVYS